jgi:hypothetical protein
MRTRPWRRGPHPLSSWEVLKDHQSVEQFMLLCQPLNFHQSKVLMGEQAGFFLIQPADKIVE